VVPLRVVTSRMAEWSRGESVVWREFDDRFAAAVGEKALEARGGTTQLVGTLWGEVHARGVLHRCPPGSRVGLGLPARVPPVRPLDV